MALALGEDRDEHIGAGDFLAAGGLHMDDGALDDALKARGGLGVFAAVADEIIEFLIDIVAQILAQHLEIDRTGAQHRRRLAILRQTQQEMFERRIFMMPLVRNGESTMESLFEVARKGGH